jgi:hypothetical protein
MGTEAREAEKVFPSDQNIYAVLESHGIRWQGEHVSGFSFPGNGKARQSWDRFAAKGMNGYRDRIGRVRKTPSGTEWWSRNTDRCRNAVRRHVAFPALRRAPSVSKTVRIVSTESVR